MVIDADSALTDAYAECERLAREHPENFPVASWLLPRALRKHVAAIYAFARTADDFADEPGRASDERLALLDAWGRFLTTTSVPPPGLFVALAQTRQQFALPVELFEELLSAFRQDVTKTRYETWEEVLDYCRRSANPVGRLVLRLFGYNNVALDQASDAVCTALQLTNFWQDFAIDWSRGRLYLPAEEWRTSGANTADLDRGLITAPWQTALARAASRTRRLFEAGRPVADGVHGRLRYELRATWLGGVRILDRLERGHFDVRARRPTLRLQDGLVIALKTMLWSVAAGDRPEAPKLAEKE
jgi:phytoene synthase